MESLGGAGPDGGVDLKLVKDGQTTVVQCKHWNTGKVGVKPVRELFGVMTAEKAQAAIFVASGRYTAEAERFTADKPIRLIGREDFIRLIRQFQRELRGQSQPDSQTQSAIVSPKENFDSTPNCPRCDSAMIRRTAKRGQNAGSQFWGCSTYPQCKGTVGC